MDSVQGTDIEYAGHWRLLYNTRKILDVLSNVFYCFFTGGANWK